MHLVCASWVVMAFSSSSTIPLFFSFFTRLLTAFSDHLASCSFLAVPSRHSRSRLTIGGVKGNIEVMFGQGGGQVVAASGGKLGGNVQASRGRGDYDWCAGTFGVREQKYFNGVSRWPSSSGRCQKSCSWNGRKTKLKHRYHFFLRAGIQALNYKRLGQNVELYFHKSNELFNIFYKMMKREKTSKIRDRG